MRRGNSVRRRKIAAHRRLFVPSRNRAVGSCHVRDQASLRAVLRSDDDIRARFSSPMASDETSATCLALRASVVGAFAEPNQRARRSLSTSPAVARNAASHVVAELLRHKDRIRGRGRYKLEACVTKQAGRLCYGRARRLQALARVTQACCLTCRARFQLAALPPRSAAHFAKTSGRCS